MSNFSLEIEALKDAITEQVSKELHVLDQARVQFMLALQSKEGLVEADLLEWLIWDFRIEGKSLIERYHVEVGSLFDGAVMQSAKTSKLAFVQWVKTPKGGFFKDILTNRDFHNDHVPEGVEEEHIALMRFFHYEGKDIPVGEIKYYDVDLKESVRRGMLEKYNEVYTAFPQTIESFIYNNPLILYAYAQIIDVVAETVDDDNYAVYQATYKILDTKALFNAFEEQPWFSVTDDFDVFVLQLPSATMGEVVIADIRMDVEATEFDHLEELKAFIAEHLKDVVLHVHDEVFTLDELLGK